MPGPPADAKDIENASDAVNYLVHHDPLVRAPPRLPSTVVDGIDGGEPLAAYLQAIADLEKGEGDVSRVLQQLEEQWLNTPAVPLCRGYRLRVMETEITLKQESDEDAERKIALLLSPLQGKGEEAHLPRRPLEWLSTSDLSLTDTIRHYADRWVLSGWLDGPEIPLTGVAQALQAPQFDELRTSTIGQIIVNRTKERASTDQFGDLDDLTQATFLALSHAAADRDGEQAAWSKQKREAAESLGTEEEPEYFLLNRALAQLVPHSSNDTAAASALLTYQALRWHGRCSDSPCVGLDRMRTVNATKTWDGRVAALAGVWQVIALKEALDTMDVGHESVLFPKAMVDLLDALLGTTDGPFDLHLLRHGRPSSEVWQALGRSVGKDDTTDWPGVRAALGAHLAQQANETHALVSDDEWKQLLQRIERRAVP
ncbi:MAG: hypothetical protein HN348_28610 [Proteobacteria bacterium]|nr:hypothetical protein [Pseudomonadota bacterium]